MAHNDLTALPIDCLRKRTHLKSAWPLRVVSGLSTLYHLNGSERPKSDLPIDTLIYDVFNRQLIIERRQHGGVFGLHVLDNRNMVPFVLDFVLPPFPVTTVAVQEQP